MKQVEWFLWRKKNDCDWWVQFSWGCHETDGTRGQKKAQ